LPGARSRPDAFIFPTITKCLAQLNTGLRTAKKAANADPCLKTQEFLKVIAIILFAAVQVRVYRGEAHIFEGFQPEKEQSRKVPQTEYVFN
jgi:hypothetical protein